MDPNTPDAAATAQGSPQAEFDAYSIAIISPPLGAVGRGSGREGDADPGPIVVHRLSPTLSKSGERRVLSLFLSCVKAMESVKLCLGR